MVNDLEGQRRISIRQSIGVSSCASSITIWPYAHSLSLPAREASVASSPPVIAVMRFLASTREGSTPASCMDWRAYSSSRLRSASCTARRAASCGSSPSISIASSSMGTSDRVKGEPLGRRRSWISSSFSHGANCLILCGFEKISLTSHCADMGSHAVFRVFRTLLLILRVMRALSSSS